MIGSAQTCTVTCAACRQCLQLCRIARPFRWQDAEPWLYCVVVRVWQTRHALEITHTRAETPDRRLVRNVRLLKLHLHLRMGTMVANLRRNHRRSDDQVRTLRNKDNLSAMRRIGVAHLTFAAASLQRTPAIKGNQVIAELAKPFEVHLELHCTVRKKPNYLSLLADRSLVTRLCSAPLTRAAPPNATGPFVS